MSEELSAESKLYVKEEIEKVRKGIREDLEKVKSKATKTFTTVVIVVGLLTGLGVYGLAQDYIDKAVEGKLGADTLEEIEKHRVESEILHGNIVRYEAEAETKLAELTKDQLAEKDGYAWIGGILFQWGTVHSYDRTCHFPIPFPNECFSVVSNSKIAKGTINSHILKWSKSDFNINTIPDFKLVSFDINYIAVGR